MWDELAEQLGGPPDLVPEAYERMSGHAQAHRIDSPILIISGDGPYLPHALTMCAALLREEKACSFGFYKNACHSFWWGGVRCAALSWADEKAFSFLNEHLRD